MMSMSRLTDTKRNLTESMLTPMEALTSLYIIKLGRNTNGMVSVRELAQAMRRSEPRVRMLLSQLKKKGVAVDRFPVRELPEIPAEDLDKVHLDAPDEMLDLVTKPRGGIEKLWTLTINMKDDEAVRRFIESRPEFERYFGLDRVKKFLGLT